MLFEHSHSKTFIKRGCFGSKAFVKLKHPVVKICECSNNSSTSCRDFVSYVAEEWLTTKGYTLRSITVVLGHAEYIVLAAIMTVYTSL